MPNNPKGTDVRTPFLLSGLRISNLRLLIAPCILLLALTAWTFFPVTGNSFVSYDDPQYVTKNVHVRQGLNVRNLRWAFLDCQTSSNWHPLTLISHMLDCQFFGLQPGGHHFTSLLIHCLNTLLVFLLLRNLTGSMGRSLFVAALFGVHPLHVESVAWISERKDVLSTLFFLLTLLAYAAYAGSSSPLETGKRQTGRISLEKRSRPLYFGALFLFVLGLFCKPMLATVPFVLLLLDYWPLHRFGAGQIHRLILEKLPFFVLATASCVLTLLVQKMGGATVMMDRLEFSLRTENAVTAYCRYLGKFFRPVDLSVFYPYPDHFSFPWVMFSILVIGALSAWVILAGGRHRFLPVGWFWFLGTLVPVIGLVQAGEQSMADRYAYIPSIGFFILVTWSAHEFTKSWPHQSLALSTLGTTLVIACAGITRHQIVFWQDGETLFRHALEVTENNGVAHLNLGIALTEKRRFREAETEYREAIRLQPAKAIAHCNFGSSLTEQGRLDEAIAEYGAAVQLQPTLLMARSNMATALVQTGRLDEAILQYREVIKQDPGNAEGRFFLGCALLDRGKTDESILQFSEVIRLEPGNAEAHSELAAVLQERGSLAEAALHWKQAILLKPNNPEAFTNLGILLEQQGKTGEAIDQFREALRLQPGNADAEYNLNAALGTKSVAPKP